MSERNPGTVDFGFREVPRTEKARMVREVFESVAPRYDAWSFRVLPALGARVAGDADSYRYLAESIRTFPDQEALADMLRDAGLERVSWRSLSGGIVAVHSGWRF
jgi:demethylmenaquinone methyltransferase / 2-methoxy-6-polyprenyl-1,4-benzoquinol methylase